MRQRIKRIIDDLGQNSRPAKSQVLKLPDSASTEWEVRRIRLENWRIVYAVNEIWQEIGVLTIQKRPPYDYEDLELLLLEL
jgi:mRNA interferase RelE/StbE